MSIQFHSQTFFGQQKNKPSSVFWFRPGSLASHRLEDIRRHVVNMVQQLPQDPKKKRSEKPSSSNHPFFRWYATFSYKIWPSNHMGLTLNLFSKKVANFCQKKTWWKEEKEKISDKKKATAPSLIFAVSSPRNHSQLFGSPLNHRRILDSWTANMFGPEQRQIALSLAYQRKGKHSTLQLKKAMTNPPFLDVYKIHPWRDIQPATNLFERPSSAGLPRMDLIHRNQPRCSNGVSTMCDTVLERKRAETTILAKRDL